MNDDNDGMITRQRARKLAESPVRSGIKPDTDQKNGFSPQQKRIPDASFQTASSGLTAGIESYSDDSKYASFPRRRYNMGRLGYKHWILAAFFIAASASLVRYLDWQFPIPKPDNQFGEFSEVRARKWLEELTSYGPRPSGSENAEVKARALIISKLDEVKSIVEKNSVNSMEVREDRTSGCFDLSFLASFTLCYRDVLNIVVRFGPKSRSPTPHSVLVNCHFDSVNDSPGATDDGVSCAMMLEILLVLSYRKTEIANDFIFLFNGAEENFLQAAHGFITMHPWRHTIRAFVNLEGAGAGGREILFQAGPGNAWLVKAYIDSAPYPHCSVVAQEVFQTGIIPSDTDFRIFRDYGRIPGLDIAYARNGYVYHTEFDQVDKINEGAIQRAGENVLATLLNLIESPYLAKPGDYHAGRWVFFDVAGLFNLFYPLSWGTVVNYLTSVAVAVKILSNFVPGQETYSSRENRYSVGDFALALCVHVATSTIILLILIGLTYVVNGVGLTMIWYARHSTILPIYLIPGILIGLFIHNLMGQTFYKKRDAFIVEQMYFDATLFIMGSILFLMSWHDFASAFLALIHTLFPLLRDLFRKILGYFFNTSSRNPWVHTVAHFLSTFPVVFIGSYALIICVEFFLPMMGRSGVMNNPEIVVAVLATIAAVSFTLYFSSWVYVSRNIGYLLSSTTWLVLLALLLLLTTSLGVPYIYSKEAPRVRRLHMQHVHREFFQEDGSLGKTENGVFIASLDYRGTADLPEHTFLQGAVVPNCSAVLDSYCSLPYYVPVYDMFPAEKTLWLPVANSPVLPEKIDFRLEDEKSLPGGRTSFTFTLRGPDHMTLFVTPMAGYLMESWSFTEGTVIPGLQTYFAFLAYGKKNGPWRFTLTFRPIADFPASEMSKRKVLIGLGSHYIHGQYQKSEVLKQLEALIRERRENPDAAIGWWKWAMTPNGWSSEYISKYF